MKNQDFEAYADLKPFNTTIAPTWDTAMTEALQCLASPPDQVSLLDYGCGEGKYYAHLLGKGLRAEFMHGVDVSKRRVERCRQIGWHNARVLVPDAVLHGMWSRLRDDPTHVTRFDHQRLTRLLRASFARVEARDFKPGYLYKRYPRPFLLHKLFFLCWP